MSKTTIEPTSVESEQEQYRKFEERIADHIGGESVHLHIQLDGSDSLF